jgi:hypothetical protein
LERISVMAIAPGVAVTAYGDFPVPYRAVDCVRAAP